MKIAITLFVAILLVEAASCILVGVDCLIWSGCKTSSPGAIPGLDNGLFMLSTGLLGTFCSLLIGKEKLGWRP